MVSDEEFIREYSNGGHIPGIPGFFPVGVSIRVDERTNTIVPDELPPALPDQEPESEPPAQPEPEQQQPEQGEALPVEDASIQSNSLIDALGKLGGA